MLLNAVDVLRSKEWFDWDNDAKPLLPGTKLIFCIQTEVTYKNKATYSSVESLARSTFTTNSRLIPVATVDYTDGVSVGNPVTHTL